MIPRVLLAFSFLLGAAAAPAAEPFHWGVNGHPVSQEAYWQVPLATQLDLVRELGAGWYRCDISASSFQANTARMDEALEGAERRGLRLLPVLVPGDELADSNISPAQLRARAEVFARQIAERYRGRITHWELGNELDLFALVRKGEVTRAGRTWEWEGAPDGSSVDDYHQGRYERALCFIQGLQQGVKAADPAAMTLVNTAGWLHHGFIERLVREDKAGFDILAWHWYSEMGDMTRVRGKLDLIALLAGYGRPLWITEINRRDGSKNDADKEMADYLESAARQLRAHPAVHAFFVYELLDEPYFGAAGESDYGLLQITRDEGGRWSPSRRKSAFEALKAVISAAR